MRIDRFSIALSTRSHQQVPASAIRTLELRKPAGVRQWVVGAVAAALVAATFVAAFTSPLAGPLRDAAVLAALLAIVGAAMRFTSSRAGLAGLLGRWESLYDADAKKSAH